MGFMPMEGGVKILCISFKSSCEVQEQIRCYIYNYPAIPHFDFQSFINNSVQNCGADQIDGQNTPEQNADREEQYPGNTREKNIEGYKQIEKGQHGVAAHRHPEINPGTARKTPAFKGSDQMD